MLILESWQQYPTPVNVTVFILLSLLLLVSLISVAPIFVKFVTKSKAAPPLATPRECPLPGNSETEQEDGTHSKTCINGEIGGKKDAHHQSIIEHGEPIKAVRTKNNVHVVTGFDAFTRSHVIPTFCRQRRDRQFAVLFLSKYDKCNIHKTQFGE